ncbi:TPA: RHS repeat protein [Candidatus Poribacteria bacterium]|nr:RHS repeat protein [Candidatus Poribacteria bacterium]
MENRVFIGHPIDVISGSVFTVSNDFILHGPLPLAWHRHYSTANLTESPLGIGWQVEFFSKLIKEGNFLIFKDEEGSEVLFDIPPEGKSSTNAKFQMDIINEPDSFVIWDWHHREKFYFTKLTGDKFQLTKKTNNLGHAIKLSYSNERLSEILDSANRRIILRYDPDGLIDSIWLIGESGYNSSTLLVRYEHDARGNLVASYDRENKVRRYEYNSDHLITKEINRNGGAFYFEYDSKNRCVHNWGDNGFQDRRLIYDDENYTTTVFDSQNRKTIYQRNELGQLTSITNPVGGKTQMLYNTLGKLIMSIDPDGGITAYEYDDFGQIISIKYPNGGVQKWTYNSLHLPETMEMPTGAVWRWEYTNIGGIKKVIDPEGGVWEYKWGNNGLISEVINPVGHRTIIKTDPDWRWLETGDNISTERLEFNKFGYVSAIYDAEGLKRSHKFDGENRIIEIIESDGSTYRAVRNADGNIIEANLPGNYGIYRYQYDAFGNLLESIDPIGGVVRWKYDSEGKITEIINEKGEVTRYEYGDDGLIASQEYFDGRKEFFERDLAGQIIAIINSNGDKTEYKRDKMGLVTERIFPDGSKETYEYNEIGLPIRLVNDVSEVSFEYDSLGRVLSDTQNKRRINYIRDKAGNFIQQHFIQGPVGAIDMEYDLRGRFTAIKDKVGIIQRFDYDPLNRISQRTLSGDSQERFEYKQRRRETRQTVIAKGNVIIDRRYEYDQMDNIISIDDINRGTTRFQYDGKENLIKESSSTRGERSYLYDLRGNLISDGINKYIYADGDRLISDGNREYQYDKNGNVSKIIESGKETLFIYDGANRLREIIYPDGKTAKYQYDPMGRRISKEFDGVKIEYVWAGDDLSAEIVNGKVAREYLMMEFQTFAVWEDGVWHTPILDLTFTPLEFINDKGELSWIGNYDPFNRLLSEEIISISNKLRSAGRYADDESGLYYNRFRYFNPNISRYMSVDPLIQRGEMVNAYWAGPNLINWIDPLGLECGQPACGSIGVDRDGVYTDPQGRRYTSGVPEGQKSILLDSGASRSFPARVRRAVNQIGDRYGCWECGSMDPGTQPTSSSGRPRRPAGAGRDEGRGNWIVDHDPPISQGGPPYRARPHCLACSNRQGGSASHS